jgi:hypothetical protein
VNGVKKGWRFFKIHQRKTKKSFAIILKTKAVWLKQCFLMLFEIKLVILKWLDLHLSFHVTRDALTCTVKIRFYALFHASAGSSRIVYSFLTTH